MSAAKEEGSVGGADIGRNNDDDSKQKERNWKVRENVRNCCEFCCDKLSVS